MNEWLNPEIELPVSADELVLVVVNGKHMRKEFKNAICIACFAGDEGWILEECPEWENPNVTHWMPLPELPVQSTGDQVNESLCSNENCTREELLQAVDQLKKQLAQVRLENAAMLYDMIHVVPHELCNACAHCREEAECEKYDFNCQERPAECPCRACCDDRSQFVHRGLCPENTKEDTSCS